LEGLVDAVLGVGDEDAVAAGEFGVYAHGEGGDAWRGSGDMAVVEDEEDVTGEDEHAWAEAFRESGEGEVEVVEEGADLSIGA
jgi:hypothetical protein